jgi:Leucine-rich repeat (LRR) protein
VADLTPLAALVELTSLDLPNTDLTSISFMSGMTKLVSTNLDGNQISDLTPLQNLTNVHTLALSGNPITDLAPLAANTGIATGDELFFFTVQTLDCQAQAANIKTIKDRGATIFGTCAN